MDKCKVKEAFSTINESLEDKEFIKWKEENNEELVFDYDSYTSSCSEGYYEPQGFLEWSLERFVNPT